MFRHLLGLGSFDSAKEPLAHKQASFPITFGGIRVIPTTTITPIVYLKNWVFIALIIATKFMADHYPFLLETLA
jgi:hypothetical protein